MSHNAIEFCAHLSLARASLNLQLDEALGTLHGLSFDNFILLHLLDTVGGGRLPVARLVRMTGQQLSGVVRSLLPLEKTGLVQRESDPGGERMVVLRPSGHTLLRNATTSAEAVCAPLMAALSARQVADTQTLLAAMAGTSELRT